MWNIWQNCCCFKAQKLKAVFKQIPLPPLMRKLKKKKKKYCQVKCHIFSGPMQWGLTISTEGWSIAALLSFSGMHDSLQVGLCFLWHQQNECLLAALFPSMSKTSLFAFFSAFGWKWIKSPIILCKHWHFKEKKDLLSKVVRIPEVYFYVFAICKNEQFKHSLNVHFHV